MTSTSGRFSGQSAFEFMFIFGIFLAALIVGTWISFSKVTEIDRYQKQMEVDYVLTSVAEKINTVWLEGMGFSTNVTLPEKISDAGYTISHDQNYIFISTGGYEYTKTIATNNLTGNFTAGAVIRLENMGDYINVTVAG